ncbi:MAG: purine-nucleoside phosphorylase [Gemmatimonadota bacterium]
MSPFPPLPDPAKAAELLATRLREAPELLVVLGSGLALPAAAVEDPVELPFEALPGFPPAGVMGHPGRYLAGRLEGRLVLFQRGRYHFYEGHSRAVVGAPIRVAAALGIPRVLLTNASGGIRPDLIPGSFVLVEDHIDLQGRAPLAGPVASGEERFPDMSAPYDPQLGLLAERAAADLGIALARGTYGGVLGPNFETPAEIRMLRLLGADVVGMSTVPEAIVARALGLAVLAISVVMNPAAGLTARPLSHEEVLAVGARSAGPLFELVRRIVRGLPEKELGAPDLDFGGDGRPRQGFSQ